MVASPPILTNDPPPTIVTALSLLNNNEPDVKLNNNPPPFDDTPAIIKADQLVPLSLELTTIITDPLAPDDATPVKTLPLSPFVEFPLVALADIVLLSRRV